MTIFDPSEGDLLPQVAAAADRHDTTILSHATRLTNLEAPPTPVLLAHAGAVSDAVFGSAPAVGSLAVDTTNLKLYVKTAANTWKSVTVA